MYVTSIMSDTVRPEISVDVYNDVVFYSGEPVHLGLEKSLVSLIKKYEKYERFYKRNGGKW